MTIIDTVDDLDDIYNVDDVNKVPLAMISHTNDSCVEKDPSRGLEDQKPVQKVCQLQRQLQKKQVFWVGGKSVLWQYANACKVILLQRRIL